MLAVLPAFLRILLLQQPCSNQATELPRRQPRTWLMLTDDLPQAAHAEPARQPLTRLSHLLRRPVSTAASPTRPPAFAFPTATPFPLAANLTASITW
jgi:hypothetical protein